MLAPGPYTRGAAALDGWNTVRSDDLDVGHRGRFFREHSDFYASTTGESSKFPQSLLLAAHIFDQSSIQRLRAKTSGSAIATLASMNPKHPIVQFRLIIVRIGLPQYLPQ
jgi:hypothetical protein